MIHEMQEIPITEHSELIDMRTHLTVAMLAASQLHRRTKDLPEAAHLQSYLDQSLKSLVDDVVRIDALMARADACVPAHGAEAPSRLPKPVQWGLRMARRSVSGICGWAHRRRIARLTVSYPYL